MAWGCSWPVVALAHQGQCLLVRGGTVNGASGGGGGTDRQTEAVVPALDPPPALPAPRRRREPQAALSAQPQTPHLEEDLQEVLRCEAGIELGGEEDLRPEKQKRKAGVSGGRGPEPWGGEGRPGQRWVWGRLVKARHRGKWSCPPLFPGVVLQETDLGEALGSGTLPAPR